VEEDILERARKKMALDHVVIQRINKPGTSACIGLLADYIFSFV
jgi:SNF2 family DNA or RNA helicase